MPTPKTQTQKKPYAEALALFVLNLVVFCGTFLLVYYLKKNQLHMQAVDIPLLKGGFDHKGLDTIAMIKKWTPLIGAAIGAAFSLILLILMLILTSLRRKSNATSPILYLIVLAGFGYLAYDLLYLEPRNTALFSGIKSFIGVPFGVGLIALLLLCVVWFFAKQLKGAGKVIAPLFFMLALSGCSLSDFLDNGCDFNPNADHCNQLAAVQTGNDSDCEKIKGNGFQGQNPPKDKCYLMSAVNSGDYAKCDKIEGGFNSYSKEQCMKEVAIAKKDMAECKKLKSAGTEVDCEAQIPQEGDNPLPASEKPVAKVSKIDGDVRVIKADGRVIPLTKDSVLGPNDKISTLDDSAYTIDLGEKGVHRVPPNTVIMMNNVPDDLPDGAGVGMSIR